MGGEVPLSKTVTVDPGSLLLQSSQTGWHPKSSFFIPKTAAAQAWRRALPVRGELAESCQSTPRALECQSQGGQLSDDSKHHSRSRGVKREEETPSIHAELMPELPEQGRYTLQSYTSEWIQQWQELVFSLQYWMGGSMMQKGFSIILWQVCTWQGGRRHIHLEGNWISFLGFSGSPQRKSDVAVVSVNMQVSEENCSCLYCKNVSCFPVVFW